MNVFSILGCAVAFTLAITATVQAGEGKPKGTKFQFINQLTLRMTSWMNYL